MNELLEKIKMAIEPILRKNEAFLVDLSYSKIKNAKKFVFFVDKDTYVTHEDCMKISKDLEFFLAQQGLVSENDQIEISSPGVDRPLKFLRQFSKHKERHFSVTFKVDDEKIETREMILKDVIDDLLIFDENGRIREIKFLDIIKARTLLKFK